MKIDWKTKLSSRKFWAAVIGFVTAILTAFNVNQLTIEQIVAIITACGTLIAYIISEGWVDSSRAKSSGDTEKEITLVIDRNKIYEAMNAVKEKQPKDGE